MRFLRLAAFVNSFYLKKFTRSSFSFILCLRSYLFFVFSGCKVLHFRRYVTALPLILLFPLPLTTALNSNGFRFPFCFRFKWVSLYILKVYSLLPPLSHFALVALAAAAVFPLLPFHSSPKTCP